jgi:hypothetical protein
MLSSGCSSPQTIVQLDEVVVVVLNGDVRAKSRCAEGKCDENCVK